MIIHENLLNNFSFNGVESTVKIPSIPVIENSRLNAAVVSINDLNSIVEDYGCDYEDAFCAIAEENNLDLEDLSVAVEDWKLIESPELATMVPNIVVKPISENNIVYQAVDYCINEYCNTGDEGYLDCLDEISQDLIKQVVAKHYKKAKDLENLVNTTKQDFLDYYNNDDDYKKDGYSRAANSVAYKYYDKKRNFNLRKNRSDDIQTYADYKEKVDDLLKRNEGINKRHHWNNHTEFKTNQYGKKVFIPEDKDSNDSEKPEDIEKKSNETIDKRKSIHADLKNNNYGVRGFVKNHKKAIGIGSAGLIGGALLAKKIAALRKQKQKHPALRGRLQAIINRLKSKLHK